MYDEYSSFLQFSEDLVSHFGRMSFQDMAHLIFGEKNQLITYDVCYYKSHDRYSL